ncbi:MAG: Hpt domain-containing protein, partial [Treponema sp.]|nr:Hpt domain-containing protein [Treponema sp.]
LADAGQESVLPQEKENPPLLDKNLVDLDTAAAIKLIGSEKLFLKILKEYYRLIPSKAASIQAHFDAEEWEPYTVEVHALKSSSRQIGAMKLSDMAAELEKAGKAGDIAYIKEHSSAALEKYCAYEQILAPYCTEEAVDESQKQACEPGLLRKEFEKVRRAALDLDMDLLEEACKTISGYRYPPEQQELLTKLLSACDEIDMDGCANIVDEWDKLVL